LPHRAPQLKDVVYIELVRSLFALRLPAMIMTAAFAICATLALSRHHDTVLFAAAVLAMIASVARLTITQMHRREAQSERLHPARARRIERHFAIAYLAYALCLGLFTARVLRMPDVELHMLLVALTVGYCAGAAASAGLRPAIAIPSMTLAVLPAIITALVTLEPIYVAMGAILAALLIGGAHTVRQRNRGTMAEIGSRLTFASLARLDGLTAIPNRLALREWFEANFTLAEGTGAIAVHYIDLDRFKPVNDRHGHPAGDALLSAVAARLSQNLRPGDIAARLGGDEFAVLQLGLNRPDDAELLAARLMATITRPFAIDDLQLEISACIGTAITADRSRDLEQLLMDADAALYRAKRRGHGTVERYAA